MSTAKQITKRFSQLAAARVSTESWWQKIASVLIPELTDLRQGDLFTGTDRTVTSEPALALATWRDGLQGYFVSQAMPWFRLRQQSQRLNEIPEVKQYHQDAEEQMYYSLTSSGFYGSSLQTFMTDAGTLGAGCQYVVTDQASGSLKFISESIENIWLDIDQYDRIDTIYRKFKLTAKAARQRFKSISQVLALAAESSPQQEFEFIHAVEPNDSIVRSAADHRGKKYKSIYLDVANNHICETAGYDRFPAVVWRPRHIKSSPYGVGPAYDCLKDITVAQRGGSDILEAAQLNMYPAMQAPSALRGRLRLHPKGITFYDDANQLIKPINQGANYPLGQEFLDRRQNIIDRHFMVDLFLMLNRSDQAKTATEVLERQGEKAAIMGPTVNTMGTDFLDPIITNTYQAESEAGRMPPVPDVLLEQQNLEMQIEYVGPLAQAQKKYFQTQGIKSGLRDIAQVMEIDGSVADCFDFDAAARELAEANAMPQKTIRSPEEVAQIRQARQAAAQQAEQVDNLGTVASAAANMNKTIETDSPLDMIAQQIGVTS